MRLIRIFARLLTLAVAVGLIGYFVVRHRVDAKSLGYSVSSEASSPFPEPCRRSGPQWRCDVSDGSGGTTYTVGVRGHCWEARRSSPNGGEEPFPRRLSGCIGVKDQIRLLDHL